MDTDELELSINNSSQNEIQVSDANLDVEGDEVRPKSDKKDVLYDVEEWRTRKDAKEKLEAGEKIKQFRMRISTLEKERNSQIFNKKHEFRKEFCELEELEMKLSTERTEERESIRCQLQKISSNVGKFQKEIENPKNTAAFVERLKILMEEIEGSMMKYKQQQGTIYEEMIKMEKQFTLDIESTQKKMESWTGTHAVALASKKPKPEDEKKSLSAPPEVKVFERFLNQTGGHQGGWDEYDHQAFLKLKKQIKIYDEFLTAAENEIPTRNRTDIIQHDEWYKEYLLLREKKRSAIAKWKDMKQSEKQELLQKLEDDISFERQKDHRKQQLLEREKQDRFSKLEKWKLDKELQSRKVLERENQAQEQEKVKKQNEEKKRREDTKVKVENYHMRKQEEERILALARKAREEEEKLAKKITEEEKERIKERDKKLLEERSRKIQEKEKKRLEKEKRLNKLKSQVEVNVKRDPDRLHQLTQGWKERKKVTKSDNSGPVLSFQHRAVPTWRKGT